MSPKCPRRSSASRCDAWSHATKLADKHFGEVQMSLRKGGDGKWRIAAESPVFPGPTVRTQYNADQLIKNLDAAGIRRAVVLSTAYWFGSPFHKNVENELAKVRAEND